MQAYKRTIFALFDGKRRYVIPLFQRQYVWGRDRQWQPLWDDLRKQADMALAGEPSVSPHFLGAIVLAQVQTYGDQVPAHEVIDGQQRLTTFQLFLAALRDATGELGINEIADELKAYTLNTGMMERQDEEQFKVWPTHADVPQFRDVLSLGSRAKVEEKHPARYHRKKLQPRPTMIEAYLFFHAAVKEYVTAGPEEPRLRARALYGALRDRLQLVSIELEHSDDPQVIFETLNARGEPLLPSDLLRNFIFLRTGSTKENSRDLYLKYWQNFDLEPLDPARPDGDRFWKSEERQGRIRRPKLDLFLAHFLAMKKRAEVNSGRLFAEYRDWAAPKSPSARPYPTVEAELADLTKFAGVFRRFLLPDTTTRAGLFASRLRDLDTTTVYPLLMAVLAGGRVAPEHIDPIVVVLESFLVRRLICNLTTKNYNRLFLQLLSDLDNTAVTPDTFRQVLLTRAGESTQWPNDHDFRKAWLNAPLCEQLGPGRVEMVLRAIEHAMQTDKNEKITIHSDLTVEHVLPQSWQAHWPLPNGQMSNEDDESEPSGERDRILHTIGNLTLLTQKLNGSISNGPFAAKQAEISKQSALRLNTYFQGVTSWDEAAIAARGKQIFETALKLWPYPG